MISEDYRAIASRIKLDPPTLRAASQPIEDPGQRRRRCGLLAPNTSFEVVLADAIETLCERRKKQNHSYSGKKKLLTLKAQVMVERATRRIVCIHTAEGRRHDFKLLQHSRVRIKKETKAVYDSGYQRAQHIHDNTALPLKKSKKKPLTKEHKHADPRFPREPIPNEHVVGSLKRFRIATER